MAIENGDDFNVFLAAEIMESCPHFLKNALFLLAGRLLVLVLVLVLYDFMLRIRTYPEATAHVLSVWVFVSVSPSLLGY